MNFVKELRKDLVSLMTAVLPNKIFYYEAPVGATLPYIVFSFLTIIDDYDSVTLLHESPLQVSIFHTSQNNLETLVQSVVDVLNNKETNITIIGYDTLRLEKTALRFSKNDEIYQADIDFLIQISQ